MIDLEVTSFMTACDAGVDALKALLQKERLRRMEQEASVRRETGWEEDGRSLGGSVQVELRPGSRPAHEHAAVTFLFERLRAVAEVAETMQVRGSRIVNACLLRNPQMIPVVKNLAGGVPRYG